MWGRLQSDRAMEAANNSLTAVAVAQAMTSAKFEAHVIECGKNYTELKGVLIEMEKDRKLDFIRRHATTQKIVWIVVTTLLGTLWNALKAHGML